MTDTTATPAPARPRPAINLDNAFFFDGLRNGQVLVQQCSACGALRHPPIPMCPQCRSLDWQAVPVGERAALWSFVVMHHPVVPPFEAGYVVATVEFPNGIRMVMNLEGVEEDAIEIGMPVRVAAEFVEADLALPVARADDPIHPIDPSDPTQHSASTTNEESR